MGFSFGLVSIYQVLTGALLLPLTAGAVNITQAVMGEPGGRDNLLNDATAMVIILIGLLIAFVMAMMLKPLADE